MRDIPWNRPKNFAQKLTHFRIDSQLLAYDFILTYPNIYLVTTLTWNTLGKCVKIGQKYEQAKTGKMAVGGWKACVFVRGAAGWARAAGLEKHAKVILVSKIRGLKERNIQTFRDSQLFLHFLMMLFFDIFTFPPSKEIGHKLNGIINIQPKN